MKRVSQDTKTKILNKVAKGMMISTAANKFGVTAGQIYSWRQLANTATLVDTDNSTETVGITQFLTAHNTFLQNYITTTLTSN